MGIALRTVSTWWRTAIVLSLLLITGCAGGNYNSASAPTYAPTHYYPPPGPPEDPWGPYITEAASRFQIPQQWIRAVMRQESGGEEQAVSPVGAIGLMQLMPETYQTLESSYGLGEDPFDPHNNILAGAAYIQQMYQRYGAPGFLAAYNAGPGNVDNYLAGNSSLPDETVNYLADVTPNLGTQVAFSGPFASYGSVGATQPTPTVADFASGCDMNAAYDPNHPCVAASQTGVIHGQPVIVASTSAGTCNADNAYDPEDPCTASGATSSGSCNADTAYDPNSPCSTAPPQTTQAAALPQPDCGSTAVFNPACPASVIASVDSARPHPIQAAVPAYRSAVRSGSSNWAIQVGAFTNPGLAQSVAQNARNELPDLTNAEIAVSTTTPFGGSVLYQSRLTHLSAHAAVAACSALNHKQLPCEVVRPASV